MSATKWIWLYSIGLGYMSMIHKVVANSGHVIVLCERWDSSTNTFHLSIEECTVTLKDFLWILQIPMEGAPIIGLSDEVGRDVVAIKIVGPCYHLLRWDGGEFHYEHVYSHGIIYK